MRHNGSTSLAIGLVMFFAAVFLAAGPCHGQCMPEPAAFPMSVSGIYAIDRYQGELVVAGDNAAFNHIAHWDGSAWRPFGAGLGRIVDDILVFRDQLYACGSFPGKVKRWNGTAWEQLGTSFTGGPLGASTEVITIFRDELIVGGTFLTADGHACNRIARWDGSAWQPLGTGLDEEVTSLAVFHDDLIVGGLFTHAGGVPASHIARWDGAAWSPLGLGTDDTVGTLAIGLGGDLVAGGSFLNAGGRPASLIASFDGTDWHDVGGGLSFVPAMPPPFPGLILSMQVYEGQLFVGGLFNRLPGGVIVSNFARWTGAAWFGVDGFGSGPYDMAVLDHDLYAGGRSSSAALRRYTCTTCSADLNGDGLTDFSDYLAYLNLFDACDAAADINEDGVVDAADYLLFMDAYAGCA